MITEIFHDLVDEARRVFPVFGRTLALDGKAISGFAVKPGTVPGDGRGDHDADWGKILIRQRCFRGMKQ